MNTLRLFGRLVSRSTIDTMICDALLHLRALVAEDDDAETVIVTHGAQVVFKALHKGDGIWLALFNPAYFVTAEPTTTTNTEPA